ncbi:hypothetical protein FRC10_011896 [Ceratobasidium sp. 414]|nr:hypothetical protein FRC10_011896 [Ceratobasidium sp. 414]
MSSPEMGYTPSHPSTSITSALDIPHSSVRRRVSGSHPASGGGVASTEPSEVAHEGERYENPFDDAHRVIPQQKLPALGRELFLDDEDVAVARAPPPAIQDQAHTLPFVPTGVSQSSCPSPRTQGGAIPRLPTPNFAAVRKSGGRADDTNMFGLLSKFTQPFRTFRAQSRSGASLDGMVEHSTVDKGGRAGHVAVALEGPRTELTNTAGDCAPNPDLVPNLSAPRVPGQATATDNQVHTSVFSAPPDTTIKLVNTELTKPTYPDPEGENHDEAGTESDEESTEGVLRRRRPPRSPTLLAAIHGATDRFTRRFPVSMSYRKANGRGGEKDDQHLLVLLGYGETGAVVEWPNAWTPEKWSLLFSVCSVFAYGLAGLLLVLMTWFGVWHHSIITRIIDYDILSISAITSASLILLATSIFGICGTLLNSRPLLAMYCVLLWPSFIGMLVVGYSAYRRAAFALPNKLDQAWSQKWGDEDRMILQYSVSPSSNPRISELLTRVIR